MSSESKPTTACHSTAPNNMSCEDKLTMTCDCTAPATEIPRQLSPISSSSSEEMDQPEYPSTTGKTLTAFPLFNYLPAELRTMIWEHALNDEPRRIITGKSLTLEMHGHCWQSKHLEGHWDTRKIDMENNEIPTPALLHTCRESRTVACKSKRGYQRVEPLIVSEVEREKFPWLMPSDRSYWMVRSDIIRITDVFWPEYVSEYEHIPGECFKRELFKRMVSRKAAVNLINISQVETLAVDRDIWDKIMLRDDIVVPSELGMPNLKEILVIVRDVNDAVFRTQQWKALKELDWDFRPRYFPIFSKQLEREVTDGGVFESVIDGRVGLEWNTEGDWEGQRPLTIRLVTEDELRGMAV